MNRLIWPAAMFLLVSCAHDERLTAAEHRAEADRHSAAAAKERAAAEDGRGARHVIDRTNEAGVDYDPSAAHLAAADEEMRRAAAHLAAATSLEKFEDEACAQIPAPERAACPLLASSVAQVRERAWGLDLVLKPQVDGPATNRMLNCHLAFARANGFAKPSCPLFVQGMTIRLQGEKVIELAGNADVARELQRQARRIFGAPATTPAVSVAP